MEKRGSLIQIAGATALVTGGARRIGRAIALALAKRGANIVVHHLTSADEAARVVEEARALGVSAWPLRADLGDWAEAEALIARAIKQAGPIGILVNNASVWRRGSIAEASPAQIAEHTQVNATAPLQLIRAVAAQGIAASVVNLLDARVADRDRAHAAYHLSKRVLVDITRRCAVEFAPLVRVNAVAPGLVLPPEGQGAEYLERLKHTNLLGRAGTVEEVVAAVLFLLEAGFTTGQVIFVDGGRHLKGPGDAPGQ